MPCQPAQMHSLANIECSHSVTRNGTCLMAEYRWRHLQHKACCRPFSSRPQPSGTRSAMLNREAASVRQQHAGFRLPVRRAFVCRAQQVALEGDLVHIHFDVKDEAGQVIESSRESGEPLSFEVGAGDAFANDMIKAFDGAVRGLAVGEKASVAAAGNPWNKDLLFAVPRDHPEMQRLDGRYKNVGGLAKDLVVELANGNQALILEVTDDLVKLDANPMLAGKQLEFEVEVVKIEPRPRPGA